MDAERLRAICVVARSQIATQRAMVMVSPLRGPLGFKERLAHWWKRSRLRALVLARSRRQWVRVPRDLGTTIYPVDLIIGPLEKTRPCSCGGVLSVKGDNAWVERYVDSDDLRRMPLADCANYYQAVYLCAGCRERVYAWYSEPAPRQADG